MMPITTGVSYTSYTPETSQTEGVIRGNVTESTSSVASNFDVSTLGKNDFMKLLLAQMQNQDPLNPTDNTEFVAQLAQFSSLEQMTEMNSNLETTLTQNKQVAEAINNAMMINYFGKKISAESDSFFYDGSNPIDLQFALDGNVAV